MPNQVRHKQYSQFLIRKLNKNWNPAYFVSINSTSKTNVAFGGITPPAPAAP